MRKPYQKTQGLRRAGTALWGLTILLLPYYGFVAHALSGCTAETAAQAILFRLAWMPVVGVALLACNIIVLQKSARRGLQRLTARLAIDAGVLLLLALIRAAMWFLA